MFTIKSIVATDYYNPEVTVKVEMPVKEWNKHRSKGWLGQLYGIDISNAVYAINNNIPASNPTVDDRRRASEGVKTITLIYRIREDQMDKAEALGFSTVKLKGGWFIRRETRYIELYDASKQYGALRLVGAS